MSHQCTCDKITTVLCVQKVGACQALSAKTSYLCYIKRLPRYCVYLLLILHLAHLSSSCDPGHVYVHITSPLWKEPKFVLQ